MTEKEFQERLIYDAQASGWKVYHTYDSRRSTPGFPDLTMVRERRLIFAELKSEKGRLTTPQREWLALLSETGAEVYVWRPSDTEEILEALE